ncbi:integrase catalytic domain-containing protein [Trichonephila clavipes]|nr:integrase catalytic domain-containing protein [Trichonephila clavipes]
MFKGAKKDLRRIASELELCVSDKLTVLDLMDLIKNCDRYKNDPDSVHELANLIIEERKYDESQQLELEKIREKSKLDLEIARIRANDKDNNTEVNCDDSSLDSLIKREKAANIIIYLNDEDLKNYDKIKSIILQEFEPTPQSCLENFKKATRQNCESHVQFASRLTTNWEYYLKLRNVSNFENTVFGYIASGSIPVSSENKPHCGLIKDNVDLEKTMRRFWEIENVEPKTIKNKETIIYSSEIKVLGVYWNPKHDFFSFRVKIDLHELNTKRGVLSTIARIYDPLGLLGPVVAKAKIFLQKLWMLKIDWTDLLPDTINREWRQFVESLQVVNDININRCIVVEQPEVIELHGFFDASQSAYGAVVYCKSITSDRKMLVHLIASKSRVAPTKQTTIPRLELCAAVLLAKLVHRVKQALKLNVTNTFLWSDSMIVLSWIRKESYQLKTFMANRIATIQEMTSSEQWRYVATEDNPADFVSRGMDSLKLKTCELWWNGPKFLMSNQYPQRQIPVAVIKDPAVHLDIVTDLTSNAFIATLKRFIFRRGKCAKLYSDNATNFVGANIELKKMFNLVCKPDEALASYMASEGIYWKFLPPRAPNFGGLWEAGVKSFKFYLKRVVGNIRLTYEEFLTVIIQIEGMLNSRPLVPLSSDLDDLNVLTPSHFLIGRSITSIVEPDLTNLNENRLDNWQKITKIIQLIWKRWSVDYLNSLQQRNKWHFEKKNAKIGDMVIIKEDNLPSCQWSLGRINNIYPGKDSKVRVVEVKTTRGIFKRPISKLCILPIETVCV